MSITAKQIADAAKDKTKRFGTRISLTLNATILALIGVAYLGVQTGHLHAAVEVSGWAVGGGTEEHAAREQQLAALSAALPSSVMTTPPVVTAPATAPLPGHKPRVTQ
jgi:hypothetical protein